jgi:Ca-activated chloride channel family protein
MRFAAPPYAYLLALLPTLLALYAYGFWRRRRALAAFVGRPLAGRLLPRIRRAWRWAKPVCLLAAIACLVVALMRPEWGEAEEETPRRGRDLVVLLDLSLSMLAEDVAPNRLEHAKGLIRGLVERVRADGGHRLALITFAGRAAVESPLTLDYGLFLERLAEASPARVQVRGSLLGDALRQTLQTFGGGAPEFTDVVLITDGDDTGSDPEGSARRLADQGIALYVVGIGDSAGGALIPLAGDQGGEDYLRYDGAEVRTRPRPELLAAIARAAKGVYVVADHDEESLVELYAAHIAAAPRREIDARSDLVAAQRFQWFVLAALFLLGVEMALREWPEAPA